MFITFGVALDPTFTGSPSVEAVLGLGNRLSIALKGRFDGDWTFTEFRMQVGPSGPGHEDETPGPVYQVALSHVGTQVLNPTLPQNSAHLVRKNTTAGGRRNRGRFYLPGVNEGGVNDVGVLDQSQITATNTALTNFLAECFIPAELFEGMVVLHSYLAGTPSGEQMAPTPVASLVCQPVIATQRRRLRR
jgi:hypothetical protein